MPAPSGQTCVRLRIEGLVQGVGFRAFVVGVARGEGLDGWVRNRRDGGVEAVLAGPAEAIERVVARCREGPPASRVDMLRIFDEDEQPAAGFHQQATV